MKEWMKNIRQVDPYVPGEQPALKEMVKLNTNENPYPPAPGVKKLCENLPTDELRLYPDTEAEVLVSALSQYYNLEKNQIFIGVGSDDVLAMAFLTFFNSQKPILFPDITYSFYDVWAELFRIPYETPPLDENFRIKKEDYYRENGGVVIANPNAPTSICEDLVFAEDILEHNRDVVVIIDEAYIDFGGNSALQLLKKYDNLLVVQTFSKSRSMAGLRIGFAMGNPELIRALNEVKFSYNSYTMNMVSQRLGVEAVRDTSYFDQCRKKIMETRERTKTALRNMGFSFPDSKANFLFITHETVAAKDIFEAMKKENIFVRYFNKPRIDNYLRVTIGTDEEMDLFLKKLGNYIDSKK